MVKDLEKHDYIEIVEFKPQPPITAAELKAVESKLGAPLAKSIRSFYEEANGLKLHWQIKPNVSVEEAARLRKKSTDYYVEIAEYVGEPFAIINLIPLEESIVKRKWKELSLGAEQETIEFDGETYDFDEFRKRLKPFDLMNREYCMAFLIEEGNGDPQVLLLSEGYTEWNSSRLTNFASYMEMLLATRGIVEARLKIFGEPGGDKKPPLIKDADEWEKKYTPKLFKDEAD
jgi:hypothetical protein